MSLLNITYVILRDGVTACHSAKPRIREFSQLL